jgi:hypothetical protein
LSEQGAIGSVSQRRCARDGADFGPHATGRRRLGLTEYFSVQSRLARQHFVRSREGFRATGLLASQLPARKKSSWPSARSPRRQEPARRASHSWTWQRFRRQ